MSRWSCSELHSWQQWFPGLSAAVTSLREELHTWVLLTGSSYPKASANIGSWCLLPCPNWSHPRTYFSNPWHLDTIPISLVWPNSVSNATWVSISQVPLHCQWGGVRYTQATPFPDSTGPAQIFGFCLWHLWILWPLQALCSSWGYKRTCKYYKTKAQHSLLCNDCVNRVLGGEEVSCFKECVTGDRVECELKESHPTTLLFAPLFQTESLLCPS